MDGDTTLLIRDGVMYLLALIMSICVHEFGHAWVADQLGDPLPRAQGRVTLNPLAHLDPIGTLLLPILAFAFSATGAREIGSRILGWGKPVEVSMSARSITRRLSMLQAKALISIAGPAMNIVFALLLSGVFVLIARFTDGDTQRLAGPIFGVIQMNIGLFFFNLIPCPPLDGGSIFKWLLPRDLRWISDELEKYGSFVLLALLMTGALRFVMTPAAKISGWWLKQLLGWSL